MNLLRGTIEHKLHTSINTIMYGDFMDILINGNIKKVIIRKSRFNWKKPDIEGAFSKISDEYFVAKKARPQNLKQIAKVDSMVRTYEVVGMLLNILRRAKGSVLIECKERLKDFNYVINEELSFIDEFKRLVTNREALVTAIQIEKSKIEEATKMTEQDYLKEWDRMEDLKKRDLDPNKILTAKWVQMIHNEIAKAERKNK